MAASADEANDPAFAPIQGIDLEGYAKAVAAVVKSGTQDPDEATKAAEAAGIPAGKWQAVSEGWVERMKGSMAVRTRYGTLFQQYR